MLAQARHIDRWKISASQRKAYCDLNVKRKGGRKGRFQPVLSGRRGGSSPRPGHSLAAHQPGRRRRLQPLLPATAQGAAGGALAGVPAPKASESAAGRRSLRAAQPPLLRGASLGHAQTGADRVRRPLQDAGGRQGGFAMESWYEIVVGVAAVSSNTARGPCDAEVRMRETSPQSSAFYLAAEFELQITFHSNMPDRHFSAFVSAGI